LYPDETILCRIRGSTTGAAVKLKHKVIEVEKLCRQITKGFKHSEPQIKHLVLSQDRSFVILQQANKNIQKDGANNVEWKELKNDYALPKKPQNKSRQIQRGIKTLNYH
jgi:hypothetical protein